MKRKICCVTTTRAEYGLMSWLFHEINNDPDLTLQLVVGGAHLSPEHGYTVEEIREDVFEIDEMVEFLLSSDSSLGVGKAAGLATLSFTETFSRLKPDVVVLLGDRFETLAVALAATCLHIPIAHIHGGEITEGALDDSFRHAVTKLSHFHFPVCEKYAKRIYQMGEDPSCIFNHGAPGLDHIQKTQRISREELENLLSIKLSKINFLCTFHPETALTTSGDDINLLFKALEFFPDVTVIFTGSNADEGGRAINQKIKEQVSLNSRWYFFDSLGIQKYTSLVEIVDVVVGNSSSGIIEVPFLKTPTVNIGDRQKGRELSDSVICCDNPSDSIVRAIKKSLSHDFQEKSRRVVSPFGSGNASEKIKNTLKRIQLGSPKTFTDIEHAKEENLHYC